MLSSFLNETEVCTDPPSSLSEVVTTKRKRKSYYIRKFPIPKILKRDIRRDIPRMIMNVLNSHDSNTIAAFFHHVCVPSCFYSDFTRPSNKTELISDTNSTASESSNDSDMPVNSETVNDLIDVLVVDMSVFPDLTVRLLKAGIVQSKDFKGSKVVLHCEMKGTKLYHNRMCKDDCELPSSSTTSSSTSPTSDLEESFPKDELHHSMDTNRQAIDSNSSERMSGLYTMSTEDKEQYMKSLSKEEVVAQRIPLTQPFVLTMLPMITLTLNEQHLCTGIEFNFIPGVQEPITMVPVSVTEAFQKMNMV
jgi:hypothetical protein